MQKRSSIAVGLWPQSGSRRWACSEVFGEPHQVAIRILNEEFTLSALIVTDPIPSFSASFEHLNAPYRRENHGRGEDPAIYVIRHGAEASDVRWNRLLLLACVTGTVSEHPGT